jgi:uncharacterized protein
VQHQATGKHILELKEAREETEKGKRGYGMKRRLVCYRVGALLMILSVFLLWASVSFVSAQATPAYPKVLRFASPSPGTMLYAVNSGLAKVASDHSPMTVVIVPTTGATAWYPMLTKQGSADIATDNFTVFWQMWTGKIAPDPVPQGFPAQAPFYQNRDIRVLIGGLITHLGMLTRKDSGLKEVHDLKGKKIAWGWSGFPPNVSITLANLFNGGLTLDDVRPVPMVEVVSAVKAVQEGRIDATSCAVGMGAIAEADTITGVRFLRASLDPERIKAGQRAMPGCYTTVAKGGVPGVPEDTPIWSSANGLLVTNKMSDDVAYKLVQTWWEHYADYAPVHPLLKTWTPDTFVNKNVTVPYHSGAVKFFKEKKVWTAEMEKIQNQLLSQ